jgi:uncharacterized protein YerC
MPHVSRHPLSRERTREIYRELRKLLKRTGNENMKVIDDLFTDTERLMLAKRCAVILLVERGVSSYAIWKSLNVSPSTVRRIRYECNDGQHTAVRQLARSTNLKAKKVGTTPKQTVSFLEAILHPTTRKMWQYYREHLA